MDAEQAAQVKDMDNTIRKVYHGKDGGRTAYKTDLDAKEIDPQITLDWVRGWFRRNIERTKQVGGARNCYGVPRAFHEYQTGLFYITARQLKNQNYTVGMSVIDV
jgi:hypothetical protein